MPWDYPNECVWGQLIISQPRIKPSHPSIDGAMKRYGAHPTETQSFGRVVRASESENLASAGLNEKRDVIARVLLLLGSVAGRAEPGGI